MNELTALDILLYGALSGATLVAVGAVLWVLAYRGRTRFSAERIQLIDARPGDSVVVTYPGVLTQDQRTQIIAAVERRLPDGVIAMVLDGGLRMSHVVSLNSDPTR